MIPFEQISAETAGKIKYVLCDIDDTITYEGKLPECSYAAMWHLSNAGIKVIPVTGRPAGWCDMIIRQWPVEAVVGENGAFVYYNDKGDIKTYTHPSVDDDPRGKLEPIREAVLAGVPGCRVSKDQFSRIYDLAIDFCEDEPKLPLSDARKIKEICESFGAVAKISSIHVNTWFGDYDKVGMTKLFFRNILGINEPEECVIFFGDSPNDEPMFKTFPMSCAVANIKAFTHDMEHLPTYVTEKEGGYGFAQAVERILELK